jgi:hypothetical protein
MPMKTLPRIAWGLVLFGFGVSLLGQQLATQAGPGSRKAPNLFGKQRPDLPETYGTAQISYIEVPANAFLPWNNAATWTSADFGRGQRWHTTAPGLDFVAPLRLPGGAQVVYLELDGEDSNAAARVFGSFTQCNYYAEGCTYHPATGASVGDDCTVPGFICSGTAAMPGSGDLIDIDLSGDGIFVDNFFGEYSLLAETYGAEDGSVAIGGMIVGYVLRISTPPGTPTFGDVPTGHIFYQHIEALAASGITGGCGGGNFCPSNPVTRGQMAAFLAIALGLQFP